MRLFNKTQKVVLSAFGFRKRNQICEANIRHRRRVAGVTTRSLAPSHRRGRVGGGGGGRTASAVTCSFRWALWPARGVPTRQKGKAEAPAGRADPSPRWRVIHSSHTQNLFNYSLPTPNSLLASTHSFPSSAHLLKYINPHSPPTNVLTAHNTPLKGKNATAKTARGG